MLKILSINVWPIASRNAIGYMTEHLLNNKQLFDVMEFVTNNVDVYENITEKKMMEQKLHRHIQNGGRPKLLLMCWLWKLNKFPLN